MTTTATPFKRDSKETRKAQKDKIEIWKRVFDLVRGADHKNWKDPIDNWIPFELFNVAKDAVEFFTATKLQLNEVKTEGTVIVRVTSEGYRAGPAGP